METHEDRLPFVMDYLTSAVKERAFKELNETDDVKEKALEKLRFLIKKEPNLECPKDDAFLIMFLRSRKFDVNRTFKLLTNFWHFKQNHSKYIDGINPEEFKKAIKDNCYGPLYYRDRTGCAVIIFRLDKWDTDVYSFDKMVQVSIGLLFISTQLFPATQVCGLRVIFDIRKISWHQLKVLTPNNLRIAIQATQYCFPSRYKGLHLLAENRLFKVIWAIVYPLLTTKLRSRFMLHCSDLDALKEYIHPSALPSELGGEAGPINMTIFDKTIDEKAPELLELLNYGYRN